MTGAAPGDEQPYAGLVASLRRTVSSGATLDLDWRRQRLGALRRLLTDHETALTEAVSRDVGKPAAEVRLTELSLVVREIDDLLANLERWTAPRRVRLPAVYLPGRAEVQLRPKGVVLIISTWNYPVLLLLSPLAGALAAGDTVLAKPSELTPTVSGLLADLLPRYLGADTVGVVTGGVPETTELLRCRFDHVFFTGSGPVGRVVMRAAAEHLTPVTLELGGKSPAFVDGTVDAAVAARRVVWAKFTNAGQSCIAPDYLFVTQEAREEVLAALRAAITEFFGADPRRSPDLGRVVNADHHRRLVDLLSSSGGRVVVGGGHEEDERYLAPTVVVDPDVDSPLMTEEIFGPVLPVLTVADAAQAVAFVAGRDQPLALYVFTEDDATRAAFEQGTSSGALGHGVALMQISVPGLPFGGVGASGMGRYHGRDSVEELSHHRSVVSKPLRPDTLALVYPPFPAWKRAAGMRLLAPLRRPLARAWARGRR